MITYAWMKEATLEDALQDLKDMPSVLYQLYAYVSELDKDSGGHCEVTDIIHYLLDALASNIELVCVVVESYCRKGEKSPENKE